MTARPNLLLLAVFAAAVALAPMYGCGLDPIKVPEQVPVEVPVACIKPEGRPQRPQVRTEADLMGMERYRRTLASWSDRLKLRAYADELEAVVEGCSRLPASPQRSN